MIRKTSGENIWLEFELLQDLPNVVHGFYLKGGPKAILGEQRHGINVERVTKASPDLIPNCDALITSERSLSIAAKSADCQTAIVIDPQMRTLAVVHSGWRGSVQNIYASVLKHFPNPENLLVCIGPSLGPNSAEFVNYRSELPESFWEFQIKPNYFDFWEISRHQLTSLGVKLENIEIVEIDTYADETFHSYRRDKTTQRHITFASFL